jgi:hypothetical protein
LRSLTLDLTGAEKAWRQRQQQKAPYFKAFSFFLKREVVDSRVIGALLSPHATHGQGSAFLERFLRLIEVDATGLNLMRTSVECEVGFVDEEGQQRWTDITVTLSDSSVIAIESKSRNAADQPKQVTACLRWLEREHKGRFRFIYLSNRPQPKSINQGEWDRHGKHARSVSIDDLCEWLAQCQEGDIAPRVKQFLCDFSEHLKGGARMDHSDFRESDEATNVLLAKCAEPEVLETIATLLFHAESLWRELWTRFLKEVETHMCTLLAKDDPQWQLSATDWDVEWYSIYLKHPSWQQRFRICFQTGRLGKSQVCYQGILPDEKERMGDSELGGILRKCLGKNQPWVGWIWGRPVSELNDIREPSQLILTQTPEEVKRRAQCVVDLARKVKPTLDEWVQNKPD